MLVTYGDGSFERWKRELEETISDYKSLESSHIELEEENKSLLDQVSKLQLDLDSLKVDMGQFQIEQNILEKNKAKLKNILEEKKSEIVLLKKSLKALEDVKLSLR